MEPFDTGEGTGTNPGRLFWAFATVGCVRRCFGRCVYTWDIFQKPLKHAPRPPCDLPLFALSHAVAPSIVSKCAQKRARHFPCVKFSSITNVAYPPIYETFLSIIGVFSLDLAWILSAACITTDVNFYHKLL